MANETPILYYWPPCGSCKKATDYAEAHGIELDKRDVEQVPPYEELLALGGDANRIPYLYHNGQLVQGPSNIISYLEENFG